MSVPVIGPAPAQTSPAELSDDEARILARLEEKLNWVRSRNFIKAAYYDGRHVVQHAGIAIPPHVAAKFGVVSGWAGTVVDVLEERLEWDGWVDDQFGLTEIYDANHLDIEASPGHLDALIYGTSFVRVGAGGQGEPSPLVTVHSPNNTTGLWDARARRLKAAVSFSEEPNGPKTAWLDLPDESITLERASLPSPWLVTDRAQHDLGRVPVAQLINRPRASRPGGRSEITRPVRYLTDSAIRTSIASEGNREFYSIPQLALLGRGEDAFQDAAGRKVSPWKILAGHVIAIDKDEDGDLPTLDQLKVGSPEPFLAMLRGLAQQLAAEAGMPPSYLGLLTDNPASADSIRAMEARLVKRAERRQTGFGRGWMEVAHLCLLIRDGEAPDSLTSSVSLDWRDASTPTRAAAADEVTKLVGAGILPPTSDVTLSRLDFTPAERRQIAADRAAEGPSATDMIAGVLNRQTAQTAAENE